MPPTQPKHILSQYGSHHYYQEDHRDQEALVAPDFPVYDPGESTNPVGTSSTLLDPFPSVRFFSPFRPDGRLQSLVSLDVMYDAMPARCRDEYMRPGRALVIALSGFDRTSRRKAHFGVSLLLTRPGVLRYFAHPSDTPAGRLACLATMPGSARRHARLQGGHRIQPPSARVARDHPFPSSISISSFLTLYSSPRLQTWHEHASTSHASQCMHAWLPWSSFATSGPCSGIARSGSFWTILGSTNTSELS